MFVCSFSHAHHYFEPCSMFKKHEPSDDVASSSRRAAAGKSIGRAADAPEESTGEAHQGSDATAAPGTPHVMKLQQPV